MRHARTYRAVAPTDPMNPGTISRIGQALLIVVILLVAVVAIRWLGERRMQPAPALAATLNTITLSVDRPEWPKLTELRFTVDVVDNVYILTDVDGDQFRCAKRPVVIADMELCPYHATIQR